MTKMRKPTFFSLSFFIVYMCNACMSTSYMGDRYERTEQVDVFYAVNDVKRNYKVIGHIAEDENKLIGEKGVKQRIVNRAKKVGADAVIILGLDGSGAANNNNARYKAEAIKYTD